MKAKERRRQARPACPFPDKAAYTRGEARAAAAAIRERTGERIEVYRCPSGDHSHLGRPHGGMKLRTRRRR